MELEHRQDQEHANIRDSQYFYLLFGKSAGEYVEEEFYVALEQFKKKGAPKIYTYFKELPEGEIAEKSVLDFMEQLDKQLGHFYRKFIHLDAIKLNFMLEIIQDEQFGGVIEFQDGQALLDKQPVLSLKNVPLYHGNETLQQKLERKKQLDEEFGVLVSGHSQNCLKEELMNKKRELGSERKRLQDEIHQIEMDMLDMCRETAKKRHLGTALNWREKRAMEHVDQGNYEGAQNILRDVQWKEEIRQSREKKKLAKEIVEEENVKIREYISGQRTLISQIKARGLDKKRVEDITDIYEDIISLAEQEQMELYVLREYAYFLRNQKRFKESLVIAEKLRGYYEEDIETLAKEKLSLLNVLANCQYDLKDFDEAESLWREALGIACRLEKENPEVYGEDVADSSNNLALLLTKKNRAEEAEELYREALKIWHRLAEKNPEAYEEEVAASSNNLAILLETKNRAEEAEELYQEALKIWRRLAEKNSDAYVEVATSSNNLAVLLTKKNRAEEAEKLYREALKIWRHLAEKNPEAYEEEVARINGNLANLLAKKNRPEEAEELYREALKIYSRLAEKNPEAYEEEVARISGNLAILLEEKGRPEEAEELYRKALKIWHRLAEKNPEAYEEEVAKSSYDLTLLLEKKNQTENVEKTYQQVEELYQEALKLVHRIVEKNPEAYKEEVAGSSHNLALLLAKKNQTEEAEELYCEVFKIWRRLAEINPEEYEKYVAVSSHNLAILFEKKNQTEEAEELYREALMICRHLAKKNPEEYEEKVAIVSNNLAELLEKTNRPEEAEELYREALKIQRRLVEKNQKFMK